jgi:8-oxo-dGTP diphosphatase
MAGTLPKAVCALSLEWGDVAVEGRPTNPADGEAVIQVLTLPPAEAVDYLAGFDDGQLTDVLRLAMAMGHV